MGIVLVKHVSPYGAIGTAFPICIPLLCGIKGKTIL